MPERVKVFVYSDDPVLHLGVSQMLRSRPDMQLVDADKIDSALVAVVVVDAVDDHAGRTIGGIQRDGCPRVVLIATELDEADVVTAAESGAAGVLRRREETSDHLADIVTRVALGDGSVPSDLVGRLLDQLCHLKRDVLGPQGIGLHGLTDRELDVLRLVADGRDTAEIAKELCYSERTVKGTIQSVTSRLNLKNRSHAVAFALRQGLI